MSVTVYFWTVSVLGVLAVVVGLVALYEHDRKEKARRRAEVSAALVAAIGAMKSITPAMQSMGDAFGKAAKSFAAFGEAFREQPGRHR